MHQVGQHLGSTERHAGHPRAAAPARILRALVHDDVRGRDKATWAVAAILTLAWWTGLAWALQTDAGGSGGPATAAVLAGGWSLTLLPVHCARRLRRGGPRANEGADRD